MARSSTARGSFAPVTGRDEFTAIPQIKRGIRRRDAATGVDVDVRVVLESGARHGLAAARQVEGHPDPGPRRPNRLGHIARPIVCARVALREDGRHAAGQELEVRIHAVLRTGGPAVGVAVEIDQAGQEDDRAKVDRAASLCGRRGVRPDTGPGGHDPIAGDRDRARAIEAEIRTEDAIGPDEHVGGTAATGAKVHLAHPTTARSVVPRLRLTTNAPNRTAQASVEPSRSAICRGANTNIR